MKQNASGAASQSLDVETAFEEDHECGEHFHLREEGEQGGATDRRLTTSLYQRDQRRQRATWRYC